MWLLPPDDGSRERERPMICRRMRMLLFEIRILFSRGQAAIIRMLAHERVIWRNSAARVRARPRTLRAKIIG
jgi:hypothetical protein